MPSPNCTAPSIAWRVPVAPSAFRTWAMPPAPGKFDSAKPPLLPPEPITRRAVSRLIFLVESDPLLAQSLTQQLRHFDYTVQSFTQLTDLRKAMLQTPPAAI